MQGVVQKAAAATAEDFDGGIHQAFCAYGGFMLTPEGPKLLEFNARFGDCRKPRLSCLA